MNPPEPRIDNFLSHFPDKKKTSNGWQAQCPAHEDNKASLCIHIDNDGVIGMKCQTGCKTEDVVDKIGLKMKDLFPAKEPKKKSFGKIVAEYPYRDEAGKELYQCVRLEPKDFRQRRPNDKGGWVWGLGDVRRVLYRLPELLKSTELVFIVEGEKDVENLSKIGMTATCNPMGAGKWRKEFNQYLKSRDVIIIPDRDEPGRKHAIDVARNLDGIAQSIKILEMPGDGKDFSAWMEAGGTPENFAMLLPDAVEPKDYQPITATPGISNAPILRILGHTYDGDLLIWYKGRLLTKKLSEVSRDWISLIMGCPTPKEAGEIREDWKAQAHKAGVFDASKKLGAGVWPIKTGWIIVSGDKALVVRSGQVEVSSSPCVDGLVIEHDDDPWVDLDLVKNYLSTVSLADCFSKLKAVVSQWTWAIPEMADVATAALMLSPFQRAMSWRAWLSVVGATSSGKSLFVELIIKKLFGRLYAGCDKSTAHGAAQTVGGKGLIAVFDEFDKSKHVPDVLELFKLAGRGGIKQSGTNKEAAYRYEIKHFAWFLAASSPGAARHDSALANRFIHLELNSGKNRTPPTPMNPATAQGLTAKIIASMIVAWADITKNSKKFESEGPGVGPDPRMVDNYSNIIGLLRTATGTAWKIPTWENCIVRSDGEISLHTILDTIAYSENKSIRTLLSSTDTMKACEKYGVCKTSHKGIEYLAIRPDAVTRHLLWNTPLKEVAIGDHLKRIPNAQSGVMVKIDGQSQRCILIPLDYVNGEPALNQPGCTDVTERNRTVTEETSTNNVSNDNSYKVTNNISVEIQKTGEGGKLVEKMGDSEKKTFSRVAKCNFVTDAAKPATTQAETGYKKVTKPCNRTVTEGKNEDEGIDI